MELYTSRDNINIYVLDIEGDAWWYIIFGKHKALNIRNPNA